MKIVKKIIALGLLCLLLLMMPTLVLASDDHRNVARGIAAETRIPQMALEAIQKSQGIIEVRMERLDGTVTYRTGSGFVVNKDKGLILGPLSLFPDFKAVIDNDNTIAFYTKHTDNTVTKVHAYVYAISLVHKLVILQLDGQVPDGMDAVVFADDIPLGTQVFAHINRSADTEQRPVLSGDTASLPFLGHIVRMAPAYRVHPDHGKRVGDSMYLDPPVECSGSMVVDASGRVVGMGNGVMYEHATITRARTIEKVLVAARRTEQKTVERGGVTPSELYTIKKLARVFEQMMVVYATHAFKRPQNLQACAYEMFTMQFSGECRDIFSSYLPPKRAQRDTELLEGHFGGIGLKMLTKAGRLVVVTPFRNTPAARAGIRPGDILKEVDGKRVQRITEAVELFRGPPGTTVALTMWRKGHDGKLAELPFTIEREVLTIKTVATRVEQHARKTPVGVVTIARFRQNTAEQFKQAVDNFLTQGIDKIVVDVRNNPGGSFRAVVQMLALFMEEDDTVLVLRKRDREHILDVGTLTAEYGVHEFGRFRELKVVVLINGGSASAAEIFAGTLQDWGFTVVGERSFGKGVGQSPITLSDDSMLLLTTTEFLVGNKHLPIRDQGVLPNIEVAETISSQDEQLDKAIEFLRAEEKGSL